MIRSYTQADSLGPVVAGSEGRGPGTDKRPVDGGGTRKPVHPAAGERPGGQGLGNPRPVEAHPVDHGSPRGRPVRMRLVGPQVHAVAGPGHALSALDRHLKAAFADLDPLMLRVTVGPPDGLLDVADSHASESERQRNAGEIGEEHRHGPTLPDRFGLCYSRPSAPMDGGPDRVWNGGMKLSLSTLWHGGDYNPDQWLDRPEVLDDDFRLFPLAGVSAVSLGIFAWTKLEPEEGRYDFAWLDALMDRLARARIKVILATPSGAKPAWMSQKYPEILRCGPNRVRDLHGQRHNHCYTSPVYRRKAAELNTKLAERYGKHPALALWHVSNEYGGECHCPPLPGCVPGVGEAEVRHPGGASTRPGGRRSGAMSSPTGRRWRAPPPTARRRSTAFFSTGSGSSTTSPSTSSSPNRRRCGSSPPTCRSPST